MKVSIITITYNSAETIEDTIRSVLSQDYSDIEYIVIFLYS
jgi:glycosyltransferase involved in cell wall biosynthesis